MSYRDDVTALAARHAALSAAAADAVREADEAGRMLADARARARLPVLDDVRTASPCSEAWANMVGSDRVRECGKCEQKVYNLSAMTREEAEALIAERNGKLCARYFRRADGTILTADCVVGVRGQRRRGWVAAAIGATAGIAAATGAYEAMKPAPPPRVVEVQGEVAMPVPPRPPSKPPTEKPRGHEVVGGLAVPPRQFVTPDRNTR